MNVTGPKDTQMAHINWRVANAGNPPLQDNGRVNFCENGRLQAVCAIIHQASCAAKRRFEDPELGWSEDYSGKDDIVE